MKCAIVIVKIETVLNFEHFKSINLYTVWKIFSKFKEITAVTEIYWGH